MDDVTSSPVRPKVGGRKKYGERKVTAQRRTAILDAATQVFASKGFHAGTLGDVAELVGMTQAGVLHHFGSKEALLRAVLDYRDEAGSSAVHTAFGLDFFRHLIATVKLNATRPGIVQTYVVLSAEAVTEDNPGTEYFTDRFDGLRALIHDEIAKLNPAADPWPDEVLQAASSNIIALMDGLQVQWLLNPESLDLVDATVFGIDAILRSVKAGKSSPNVVIAD